jgi:DNA-binding response OmpR family regulator
VEDNHADVFLIREAIESASLDASLQVVQDGEKAIKYFQAADSDPSATCPTLVILDINLPKKPGREVLRNMRLSERCGAVPVLVVTSSDSQKDRDEMGRLGVIGYFRKSSEYDEFMKLGPLVKGILED